MKVIAGASAILLSIMLYMYNSTKAEEFQEQVYKYMLKECGPKGSLMVLFALDGSDAAAGGCHKGEGIMQFSKGNMGDLKVLKGGTK